MVTIWLIGSVRFAPSGGLGLKIDPMGTAGSFQVVEFDVRRVTCVNQVHGPHRRKGCMLWIKAADGSRRQHDVNLGCLPLDIGGCEESRRKRSRSENRPGDHCAQSRRRRRSRRCGSERYRHNGSDDDANSEQANVSYPDVHITFLTVESRCALNSAESWIKRWAVRFSKLVFRPNLESRRFSQPIKFAN
jgi:hypothetical protein